jgi:hypothetical protein
MSQPSSLTRHSARLAYTIAATTDVLQFALGPLGWVGADEVLDVVAMVLLWRILGFHPLLLPTFVVELLPVTDLLPTWTGCVALVIALRRREQDAGHARTPAHPPGHGQIIDV